MNSVCFGPFLYDRSIILQLLRDTTRLNKEEHLQNINMISTLNFVLNG